MEPHTIRAVVSGMLWDKQRPVRSLQRQPQSLGEALVHTHRFRCALCFRQAACSIVCRSLMSLDRRRQHDGSGLHSGFGLGDAFPTLCTDEQPRVKAALAPCWVAQGRHGQSATWLTNNGLLYCCGVFSVRRPQFRLTLLLISPCLSDPHADPDADPALPLPWQIPTLALTLPLTLGLALGPSLTLINLSIIAGDALLA